MLRLAAPLLALAAGLAYSLSGPVRAAPKKVDFNRDVRPILSEHCFVCHGPSAKDLKADLRLDDLGSVTKDRGGYSAIVPGNPDRSKLWQRVSSHDSLMRMPPQEGGKPLSDAQKATIRAWIEQGAEYKAHWAYVPPKMPALPVVGDDAWVRNPIDRFVLASIEAAGLGPEPEADKVTLIRRLALTLTGLPPTPEEVTRFVEDRSPTAYADLVDRLLASPRYGEHQARYWLDAVRYGDTHGLHLDNERSIYPYRDWVVRAFNDDLPFDQFTIWQLAGDMLKNPTMDQKIASGYIRMNPTTNEGGAIEQEFYAKNTFDRVETTATVFLGSTMTCARCHDHKYDPISAKDYYGVFAYFNSTKDKPLDGNELFPAPAMRAFPPLEDRQMKGWESEASALEAQVDLDAAGAWIGGARIEAPTTSGWKKSKPFPAKSFDEAYDTVNAPEPGASGDPEWQDFGFEIGKPANKFIAKENAAGYVRGVIHSAKPRELEVRINSDDAVKVWVNGRLVHQNKILRGITLPADLVKLPLDAGDNQILIKVVNGGGPDGIQLTFGDAVADRINAAYLEFAKDRAKAAQEVRTLFLLYGPDSADAARYRDLRKRMTALEAMQPMTLIAEEMPEPVPAYVLHRGEYDQPKEKVSRSIPAALGALPAGAPVDRLGFAYWLVDPKNSLVSRVIVNRIWQQHFGVGIVKTAEDFGSQGEWPSHPELLDYLALKFMREGWSMKKLHKLILTSAAFRQAATASPEKIGADPENRLISRGPRFRLDAEVLRDQALYVSGLLNETIGGRGFKPYQPPGIWEAITFVESTTSKYVQEKGDAIYRRSLYLFWKRTAPHPTMLSFDAPMRETCQVRRSRTNTPLQALVTLNEPAFLEAARALATRVWHSGRDDDERLSLVFRHALGRAPSVVESTVLNASLRAYIARYRADTEGAASMLRVGDLPADSKIPVEELAAWSLICSTVLNTDEFLTQH